MREGQVLARLQLAHGALLAVHRRELVAHDDRAREGDLGHDVVVHVGRQHDVYY